MHRKSRFQHVADCAIYEITLRVRKRAPIPDAVPEPRVIIIGGGISGLACAAFLRLRHIPYLLLEKSHRVGGLIDSEQDGGFLFECGPQSFRLTPSLKQLIDAAGMGDALLQADPRAPRFILHGGRLVPAPMSPFSLFFTPLLDVKTVFQLLLEPLGRTVPPMADETVAAFVRRKFGERVLQNFVSPFVSGIFAGDAEKLSLRAAFPEVFEWEALHGSVLRGAVRGRKKAKKISKGSNSPSGLCSLKRGNVSLASGLGKLHEMELNLESAVASIAPADRPSSARFEVVFERAGALGTSSALAVVLATDAHTSAVLLSEIAPEFSPVLQSIQYAPIAVVSLGYRKTALREPPRGFGFLVPREEKIRTLGTAFNSSLFPNRAPADHVLMTSFVGGALDPEAASWPDDLLVDTAHAEVSRILKISGRPAITRVTKYEHAIPQYNLGHVQKIARLTESCRAHPGIFLTGNYLAGPSLGACAAHAEKCAAEVAALVKPSGKKS